MAGIGIAQRLQLAVIVGSDQDLTADYTGANVALMGPPFGTPQNLLGKPFGFHGIPQNTLRVPFEFQGKPKLSPQ